jgi:hypothetical protein
MLGTKQVEVVAKPIERTIVQPVMPREIDLKEPMWFAVTEANIDKFIADIKEEHGDVVFLAMSIPDYEIMAYNMQELKRYITELKEVVVYYRKVTMPAKPEKKETTSRERPSIGLFPRDKKETSSNIESQNLYLAEGTINDIEGLWLVYET